MIIKEIKDKNVWEGFILKCSEKTFCQSWNWGHFNNLMGDTAWRFGIFEGDELIAVAQVLKIKARRGVFLFCSSWSNYFERRSQEDYRKLIKLLKGAREKRKSCFYQNQSYSRKK